MMIPAVARPSRRNGLVVASKRLLSSRKVMRHLCSLMEPECACADPRACQKRVGYDQHRLQWKARTRSGLNTLKSSLE